MSEEPQSFLSPTLAGARFDDHGIPLEVLADLAALKDLIAEVAKAEFLRMNGSRKRSPRGFTDGLNLKLTAIKEGSAVANIELAPPRGQLFDLSNRQYYESAREVTLDAISAAESDSPSLPPNFPVKALANFQRLGRSLRPGESFQFERCGEKEPACLTPRSRRNLLLASDADIEITEDVALRGYVFSADQKNHAFKLQLSDEPETEVPFRCEREHRQTALDASFGFAEGTCVEVSGVARYNKSGSIIRLDSLQDITILDALDVSARIDELRLVKAGWMDGGAGVALDSAELDWLENQLVHSLPTRCPLPHIFPMENGGVQLEWTIETSEISVEIDMGAKRGEWHSLDMESGCEDEHELDFGDESGWNWVEENLSE